MIKDIFLHPLTRGLDLDDPATTTLRRKIISDKKFLKKIYQDWYQSLINALPEGEEPVLELGSGAGFLDTMLPGLVSSELFFIPGMKLICDGQSLPFKDHSLRGILMTDVLHHIPQSRRFFQEATRCLQVGGAIAMVEPWVTWWSRLIYTRQHHELFDTQTPRWEFETSGPLSGANTALPWILFERDRERFEEEFPLLQIRTVEPFMPFRYLVSGGISLRSLTPHWSYPFWCGVENLLHPWMKTLGLFAIVTLTRVDGEAPDRQ